MYVITCIKTNAFLITNFTVLNTGRCFQNELDTLNGVKVVLIYIQTHPSDYIIDKYTDKTMHLGFKHVISSRRIYTLCKAVELISFYFFFA
jgi:hypothetical protein